LGRGEKSPRPFCIALFCKSSILFSRKGASNQGPQILMNKRLKAQFASLIHRKDVGLNISLCRNVGLSILEAQEVQPRKTPGGSPFPLVACSFDELLAPTASNCYKALVRYAADIDDDYDYDLPSRSDFRNMNIYENRSILHGLNLLRRTPYSNVWYSYLELLRDVENETPTRLYPWVAETLRRIMEHFHLVIVTSNRTHDVARMVRNQTGITEHFDVVKVPRANKGLVLATLAGYHKTHHGDGVWIPFDFFCRSEQDVRSAEECGRYVSTYCVANQHHLNGNGSLKNYLRRNSATHITADEILSTVYGYRLHSLGYGQDKCS
jgi:hypothetical protein